MNTDWHSPEGATKIHMMNTITKYPSIATYHQLGDRGVLQPGLNQTWPSDSVVYVTEKVDGTNARIIFIEDTYFIGSREEIWYAKGDVIRRPDYGIVDTLIPVAEKLDLYSGQHLLALHFEVFGHKTTPAWKRYSSDGVKTGFRLLDYMSLYTSELSNGWDLQRWAAWRDSSGQDYLPAEELPGFAAAHSLPVVPLLWQGRAHDLPTGIRQTRDWLEQLTPETKVGLPGARSEGVVLRTADRNRIAKARFEDYDKTLRILEQAAKAGAQQ